MAPVLKLFARFPEPGKAKTRLIPALGTEGAARVHRVLTERTVTLLQGAGCPVEVHYSGADATAVRDWLGGGVALVEQIEGGLGEKLTAALGEGPSIFFGADTPDLTADHIEAAIAALASHDIAIGPAEDGGYWAIGMAAPQHRLFEGIDWSTDWVFGQTLAKTAKLKVAILATLADCDRPEDLARWPWLTA